MDSRSRTLAGLVGIGVVALVLVGVLAARGCGQAEPEPTDPALTVPREGMLGPKGAPDTK